MRRLRSTSLVGQMAVLTLLALVLSQGIGFLIYREERAHALRGVHKEEFVARTAAIARLLEATSPALHEDILDTAASTYTRYWLAPAETVAAQDWQRVAWQHLAEKLGAPQTVQTPAPAEASTSSFRTNEAAAAPTLASWEVLPANDWPLRRPAKILLLDQAHGLGLEVQLRNGAWLNAFFTKPLSAAWSMQSYVSLGITALGMALIAAVTARRIARPLRHLAQAAERLGRGEEVAPVPEDGPADVRHTAEAFNRMQSRLRSFIEDRTLMLASVGHDLRTPITALRLHTEFVTEPQAREKLSATLDEMQAMTEAALTFAREEATGEATRSVDVAALLDSLCDDLADLGWDVSFAGGTRSPYSCRPDAIRRAVRNLIENAVRYGERARVAMVLSTEWLEIAVEDDGPGIPDSEFERVFAPFVRLESSRNRATGGVGLGLAIVRTTIRGHGGDVALANRPGGGLRATIRLPLT